MEIGKWMSGEHGAGSGVRGSSLSLSSYLFLVFLRASVELTS